jgi:hypothetical protein
MEVQNSMTTITEEEGATATTLLSSHTAIIMGQTK